MQITTDFEKAVNCVLLPRFRKNEKKENVDSTFSERLLKGQFHKLCEELFVYQKIFSTSIINFSLSK